MNLSKIFTVLIPIIILTGCGDNNQLIPVGTNLPNGYVVNESVATNSMDECLKYAANKRSELRSSSFHETNDGHTYTAVANFPDGSDMLQLCKKKNETFANYASARK